MSDLIRAGVSENSTPTNSVVGDQYGAWYKLLPASETALPKCKGNSSCFVGRPHRALHLDSPTPRRSRRPSGSSKPPPWEPRPSWLTWEQSSADRPRPTSPAATRTPSPRVCRRRSSLPRRRGERSNPLGPGLEQGVLQRLRLRPDLHRAVGSRRATVRSSHLLASRQPGRGHAEGT